MVCQYFIYNQVSTGLARNTLTMQRQLLPKEQKAKDLCILPPTVIPKDLQINLSLYQAIFNLLWTLILREPGPHSYGKVLGSVDSFFVTPWTTPQSFFFFFISEVGGGVLPS
jgi:hypothetical protein